MLKISEMSPRLTVNITDEERNTAKVAKKQFKASLKDLKAAIKVILDLRDSILQQHPSKEQLNAQYKGRLLRYKRKITDAFNVFLDGLQDNLRLLGKIGDPDMIRLREILVAEISELSDGIESFLDLLGETDRDNFTQTLEQLVAQLEKREASINDVISNQLFNHLDHDLLGRLRISDLKLNIQKRSRLLAQLLKE